jgi:hypothetical protein
MRALARSRVTHVTRPVPSSAADPSTGREPRRGARAPEPGRARGRWRRTTAPSPTPRSSRPSLPAIAAFGRPRSRDRASRPCGVRDPGPIPDRVRIAPRRRQGRDAPIEGATRRDRDRPDDLGAHRRAGRARVDRGDSDRNRLKGPAARRGARSPRGRHPPSRSRRTHHVPRRSQRATLPPDACARRRGLGTRGAPAPRCRACLRM